MATPIGRLTKKTQCQLSAWVRIPPASRPSEPPATDTKTYALIARARSLGLGELGDDDREDHRGLGGGADALQEAGGDQRALARGEAAQERGGGERDEAGQEHALAAGEIAEPPREQQQAPEGDQERVDDPGEVRLAEVEVALDRGQRDVHDRDVEHDHQLRQADDDERRPATAVGWWRLCEEDMRFMRIPTCR